MFSDFDQYLDDNDPTRHGIYSRIVSEVARQDVEHPNGYPLTRDGMRLGVAALSDELTEVWTEWNLSKRHFPTHHTSNLEVEIVQLIAVGIRMLRSLREGSVM